MDQRDKGAERCNVRVTEERRDVGRQTWLVARQTDGAAGSFWIKTVLTGAEQHVKPAVVHHLPPSTKEPTTTAHCVPLYLPVP